MATRPFKAPLLPSAAALITGVVAGRCFTFFPYSTVLVSLTGSAAFFLFVRLPLRQRLAAAAFYALGFTAFYLYGPGAPSPVEQYIDKGPVPFTGEVVRPPGEREGYTLVFLSPDPPKLIGRRGIIRLSVRGTGLGIAYGDVLQATLKLSPPKGFKNPGTLNWGEYARLNGIDAMANARPEDFIRLGNRAGPFLKRLYSFRQDVMELSRLSMPEPAASLFRGLVLGDQGGITDKMRDDFQASGTSHILAVSGSHVALLAGLLFFLVKWSFLLLPRHLALRLSLRLDNRKVAAAVAIPACILYFLLSGSHVATVRSVIMITVFLSGLLLNKDADLLNVLSAAALAAVLWDPSAVFDISFRLSYCAVLFIALAVNFIPKPEKQDMAQNIRQRILRKMEAFIIPSAAVIIGISPLVARQFNSFSYMALSANLVVMPFAGFAAVPAGLLSCLIHAISPGGALPLAGLNTTILNIFYGMVRFFASAPSANLHPAAPGILLTTVFYASIGAALLWRTGRARKGAALFFSMSLLTAVNSIPPHQPRALKATFLDVGQGDSALVQLPDGQHMLVDGGGSVKGVDPGRAAVAPYLWNHGIRRLDYVVLTHPHSDHMDGLIYILENFEVGQVWEGGLPSDADDYKSFQGLIGRKKIPHYVLSGTGEMPVGGATVQVLHTAACDAGGLGKTLVDQQNNSSLVLRVKYEGSSFLLTGDIERETEMSLLDASPPLPLKSAVLKVPHHGSRGSCDLDFFNAVGPRVAVISVGRGNPFHLPSLETVSTLTETGAKVFRTDMDGAVTVTTDGKDLEFYTYEDVTLNKASSWRDEIGNWKKVFM